MDFKAMQRSLREWATELLRIADDSAIAVDSGPDARTHVFVDTENVQPREADVRALVPEASDIWLFHGPNQKNVTSHYASFGERATAVPISRTGKNSLDFHLSFYMGYIASRQPHARFVAMSNDTGYGPMLDHAKALGFAVEQIGFGAARPKVPAKKAAPKQVVAVKSKAPAKKATAKKASAPAAAAKKGPVKKSVAEKASAKSYEQVVAMLRKSAPVGRPHKHARLLAHIASLLGVAPDAAAADAMLFRLVTTGAVTIDDKNSVTYSL